eukprot:Partr_v1_DN28753_c0_g1_i5_m63131 putative G patch domain and ankyrin repeats 1
MSKRIIEFVPEVSECKDSARSDDNDKRIRGRDIGDFYRKLCTPAPSKVAAVIEDIQNERYTCADCNLSNIPISQKHQHLTSLAHQLSVESRQRPQAVKYELPPSNKGYKLMQDIGWQEHQGLGTHEQGRHYPIATQIRLDRSGIGSRKLRTRKITHTTADVHREELEHRRVTSRSRSRKQIDRDHERDKAIQLRLHAELSSAPRDTSGSLE